MNTPCHRSRPVSRPERLLNHLAGGSFASIPEFVRADYAFAPDVSISAMIEQPRLGSIRCEP